MELKSTSNDAAQTTVNNKTADSSQINTVIDRRSESDVPTHEHLDRAVLAHSPRDVNSLVVVSPVEVSIAEANAAESNVLDDCECRDDSQIKTVDVSNKSDKSIQDEPRESDRNSVSDSESCIKPDDILCFPTPKVADVNEICGAAVNGKHTSPPTCEDLCHFQNLSSCSSPKSESPEQDDSVKETNGCALSGTEKATVEISSSKDVHVFVDLHGSQNLRSLGSPCLPEAETTKCAVGGSHETLVNGDHSVLVVRDSEIAELPSITSVTFQNPLQQGSVTETDDYALSCAGKPTVEISSSKDLPVVVDLHSSPSPRFLDSLGLRKCVDADKCRAETLANDDHSMVVVRRSREMAKSPSVISVTTESTEQQDSVMETDDCTLPSSSKATIDMSSINMQCCYADEGQVEASVLMADAQNSPVQFPTSSSVGCSPVQLATTVAEVSHNDTQLTETVVQTSARVVDSGCSPLHHVLTHSIGCSPFEVGTRSARTSPMLLLTVGCSMQTEPWLTDAQCSPMVPPVGEDTTTSPQQYMTKHSTGRLQSQPVADSTSPSSQQNNQLPACSEALCRKLSSIASAVESESSYATPPGMACSNEDPLQVAATDSQQSAEDSTQPHSCEELFGNDSPLSYRSPSSVPHQPCSTFSSQHSHLQSSHCEAETENFTNSTQPADSGDHAVQKLL